MRDKFLVLLATIGLHGLASEASRAQGLYGEWAHASNARATERNLGRNFFHLGWRFPNGFLVSGGAYLAGEKSCFASMTFGKSVLRGRWQATVTEHAGGSCSIDSRRVHFERNLGVCMNRIRPILERFSLGFGGCLWQRADYTIGDYAIPGNPQAIVDDGAQPTANFLFRFKFVRRSPFAQP